MSHLSLLKRKLPQKEQNQTQSFSLPLPEHLALPQKLRQGLLGQDLGTWWPGDLQRRQFWRSWDEKSHTVLWASAAFF
jgi:hypothetical protein